MFFFIFDGVLYLNDEAVCERKSRPDRNQQKQSSQGNIPTRKQHVQTVIANLVNGHISTVF